MNITLNKTDSVNAVITIEVEKADYVTEVENSLKDLRKNAVVDGFRKGMVPPSFIRQKYGKAILFEEINKLISKKLSDYIQENKPDFLGDPLPSENQKPIDFDKQEDFVFTFDIGLSPKIDVKLTKDDQMPYYQIQITEEMIEKQIENFKSQFGSHEMVDDVEEKDLIKGNLVELDESGNPKENGMNRENVVLMPLYIKNNEEKAKFLNSKPQTSIVFNPHLAYEGNEAEISSLLNIKKDELNNHSGDFSFEITEISRYKPAELNQDLFDKIFGPGIIDSDTMFRNRIKENLKQQLSFESDYKFFIDIRKLLEEKVSGIQLPDAYLKRWLLNSDKKRTPESIEEEYPEIIKELRFHLIKEHLIEENEITIEENDLQEYAKQLTKVQFSQYGMYNISDDSLNNYAQEMLKKQETYKALGDKIFEDKLIKILKEQVTLEPNEISAEEFRKMIG